MGQTLERFFSVSEEKKNKEIDRIVGEVYKKYLEKFETGKSIDKPQTSKKTEENKKSIETSEKKAPGKNKESTEASKKAPGENKESTEASKKAPGENKESTEASEKKALEENKESNEASKMRANFYMAVCEIVGELNKTFGNTQFKVPNIKNLEDVFKKHHSATKAVTKDEFQRMLQDILTKESLFPGFGAKDALVYIFTVPAAAVLAKQRFFPRAIRNDVLIPGVTSATIFALAKLNKI